MSDTPDTPQSRTRPRVPRRAGVLLGGIALAAVLTACGGAATGTPSNADAGTPGAPVASATGGTGGTGGGAGAGSGREQWDRVLRCLSDAGIKAPTTPVDPRTATEGDGPRGLSRVLEDPAAKQALAACGLQLPQQLKMAKPSS